MTATTGNAPLATQPQAEGASPAATPLAVTLSDLTACLRRLAGGRHPAGRKAP